jgi:hypothetical protein
VLVALAAERVQEFVEQRDRRAPVDGGAGAEGILPAGLERGLEVVAHTVRGVGVEAAHAWYLVAQALLGEDLGDAVLGHPRLVAVPQAVGGQAELDRQPAGQRGVLGEGPNSTAARGVKPASVAGAGGHMATGFPGQAVASAMTSRAGRLGAGW